MTVKEKLKQEEEKLLESVNNSYRDMMITSLSLPTVSLSLFRFA